MHRGWQDADVFGSAEYSERDAWVWLIESACWQPKGTRIKGETIALSRGQMSFSVRFLAVKWGWSKSRVDRFLKRLTAENMILTCSKIGTTAGHAAGQGQSIITICNYDIYQAPDKPARDSTQSQTGTTAGQQRDKEEEGKKGKKEEGVSKDTLANGIAESVVSDWNAMASSTGLPSVTALNETRRKAIRARIAEHGSERLTEAIRKIGASQFCTQSKWCGFDWLLKPANLIKVLEGNYDGTATRPVAASPSAEPVYRSNPALDRYRALIGELDDTTEADEGASCLHNGTRLALSESPR